MKGITIFLIFTCSCIFGGYSPLLFDDNHEKNEDSIEGAYFVHGTIIQYKYDFPWPQWGGEEVILSTDTTQIAFTVNIFLVEDNADTVQFYGLEGVNSGENNVLRQICDEMPSECAFATLNSNGEFAFFYETPGGEYTGTGILKKASISLDTFYEYRDTGIDYQLTGQKIKDFEK